MILHCSGAQDTCRKGLLLQMEQFSENVRKRQTFSYVQYLAILYIKTYFLFNLDFPLKHFFNLTVVTKTNTKYTQFSSPWSCRYPASDTMTWCIIATVFKLPRGKVLFKGCIKGKEKQFKYKCENNVDRNIQWSNKILLKRGPQETL